MLKHKRALFTALVVVIVLAVTLSSTAASNDPIVIAGLFSLSTGASMEGISQRNGTSMAIDEINAKGGIKGRRLDLQVEDVGDSPATSINALNRVLAKKPVAIMGPLWGTHLLAYEPTIREERVPILAPSGSRAVTLQDDPYYFRYHPHDGISKAAQVRYAITKLGKKKPAIIYVADEYGQSGRDVMLKTLKELGITAVAVESINPGDKDATAQIKKIKDSGADVLLSQDHAADFAIVMRAIKTLGLNIPQVAGTAAAMPATTALLTGDQVNGMFVETAAIPAFDSDPAVKSWTERYKAKYKTVPDPFALLNYDATMMLAAAIEKAGPDRAGVRNALASMAYKGIVTTYSADKEGNEIHTVTIIKYDSNKVPKVVDKVTVPKS